MTTLPDNHQVTATMTGKQMRAIIDAVDLRNADDDLSRGVLYLMAALHQAETIYEASK